jgi:hypothetical protein
LHLIGSINDANSGSESEYNDGDAVAIYTKSSNNNDIKTKRIKDESSRKEGMGK